MVEHSNNNEGNMNENSYKTSADQEKNAKNGFALLSHDLRSSLAGVMGSLSIISNTKMDEETGAHLARAQASVQMLQELLNLAFDMEGDQAQVDNTGGNVSVIDELVLISDIWRPQCNAADGEFSVIAPIDVPLLVSFDRVSFHRILNNLIGNSIKFSSNGSISVTVRVSVDSDLQIDVMDNGPGFSEAALEKLFQFKSRPENSDKPGTGLGLYISSTLTKDMGGTISAQNRAEGGAIVSVTFPACETVFKASIDKVAQPLPDLSHLNILLAEDNITNQLVVTQMLKSLGAKFIIASDGIEALSCFEEDTFDVVLLDIEMPRKSGLEVLREIRSRQDSKAKIPLLALTAYVLPEHKERIMQAGADGIIPKPIQGIAPLGRSILKHLSGVDTNVGEASHEEDSFDEETIGDIDMDILGALKGAIGPDTINEFWGKVIIDLESMQTSLIEGEASGNGNEILAASHTLVSVAGAIGAVNLQKCAGALNTAAKNNDGAKRQSLNMLCIKGILDVLAYIKLKQTQK